MKWRENMNLVLFICAPPSPKKIVLPKRRGTIGKMRWEIGIIFPIPVYFEHSFTDEVNYLEGKTVRKDMTNNTSVKNIETMKLTGYDF